MRCRRTKVSTVCGHAGSAEATQWRVLSVRARSPTPISISTSTCSVQVQGDRPRHLIPPLHQAGDRRPMTHSLVGMTPMQTSEGVDRFPDQGGTPSLRCSAPAPLNRHRKPSLQIHHTQVTRLVSKHGESSGHRSSTVPKEMRRRDLDSTLLSLINR